MLDLSHLVNSQASDVQIFDNGSVAASNSYAMWTKPRGISMVYMLVIGAGGGGSSGETGAGSGTVSNCASGGGGASGSQSTLLIPAIFLPDVLYIKVGAGGAGGLTANSAGAVGGNSNVMIYPMNSGVAANTGGYLLNAGGGGGAAATSANAGGVGGTAGPIATIAVCNYAGLGVPQFLAGQAGATGLANNSTTAISLTYPQTGLLISGGAGGGAVGTAANTNTAGQNVIFTGFSTGILPNVSGGIAATGATPAGAGSSGLVIYKPLLFTGGAGGGAANLTSGGAGGRGGPGCGGGGGGGGAPGGVGGQGGDGLVIIIGW